MSRQWLRASGYLAIFLMPALFLVGCSTGRTWLAFGTVVIVFPLARILFDSVPPNAALHWDERVATTLDRLPLIYVPVLIGCVVAGLWQVASALGSNAPLTTGVALSLWMTLLFGTCVAHELIHRRDKRQSTLGYVLAGFCGHPLLAMEHLAHHARPGETDRAECPLITESLWQFAGRRLRRIGVEFCNSSSPLWNARVRMPSVVRTRFSIGATLLTWVLFAAVAGLPGAALYLGMMIGVVFGVQLITYLQHWGLGDDSIPDRVAFGRGWEEDCRFQAWITLNISLHDAHHRDSSRPYYLLSLAPDSPRLPAGYVLLMFASLVPAIWRSTMTPALRHWLANPLSPSSSGRRLTCFGLSAAKK